MIGTPKHISGFRLLSLSLLVILAALLCGQFLAGGLLIKQNFPHVSTYGDTREYLHLAETLVIRSHRGILYPLILAGLERLAPAGRIQAAYGLQLLIGLCGLAALMAALLRGMEAASPESIPRRPWWCWLLLLAAFWDPLNLHFATAIMSDSLTAGFTLLFLAGVILIWGRTRVDAPIIIGTMLAMIAVCLTRSERIFPTVAFLAALLAIRLLVAWRRGPKPGRWAAAASILLVLTVGGGVAIGIDKGLVKHEKSGFSAPDTVRILVATRIGRMRFDRIAPHLQPATRHEFAPDGPNADILVGNAADYLLFAERYYPTDPGRVRRAMDDIIATSLRREPRMVLEETVRDMALYFAPVVGWPLDWAVGVDSSGGGATHWTLSCLVWQSTPTLLVAGVGYKEARLRHGEATIVRAIGAGLKISALIMVLELIVLVLSLLVRPARKVVGSAARPAGIILLFAAIHAPVTTMMGPFFLIRYAMPVYLALLCLVHGLTLSVLCRLAQGDEREERPS